MLRQCRERYCRGGLTATAGDVVAIADLFADAGSARLEDAVDSIQLVCEGVVSSSGLGAEAIPVAEVFSHFDNARLDMDNPFGRSKDHDWLLARFDMVSSATTSVGELNSVERGVVVSPAMDGDEGIIFSVGEKIVGGHFPERFLYKLQWRGSNDKHKLQIVHSSDGWETGGQK